MPSGSCMRWESCGRSWGWARPGPRERTARSGRSGPASRTRVSSSVGKAREAEVASRIDPPPAVAIVHHFLGRSLHALRGEEIADSEGEPEPAGIASRGIGGMTRRIEHGAGENGRREILEGRRGVQFREASVRLRRLESSLDGQHPGFHQAVVASGHEPDDAAHPTSRMTNSVTRTLITTGDAEGRGLAE